ncbi:MAG: low molecular weight protein-tyrosine-phosphatase [Peptococcaceae bacterium]|nr:low molecular weight protein-tyrosine-phosphatase [Peptococcaceae bacterium]
MTKILFICHGNICRSAMAESMCRQLLAEAGREDVVVDSAATSREEIGNPMYPPAQAKLTEKGVAIGDHRARQLEAADYDRYDWLIGMDEANMRNIRRICGGDPAGKVHLLLALADEPRPIADPWYTDDFETTYRDLARGLAALLAQIPAEG